jgi:ATP-dependent Clp protease ATP-binding subunit ClpA
MKIPLYPNCEVEYGEKNSVSKSSGAPSGYSGYDDHNNTW